MIGRLRNWRLWIAEGYVAIALFVTAAVVVFAFFTFKAGVDAADRERAFVHYREQARLVRDGELASTHHKVGEGLVSSGRLGRGTWGFRPYAPGRVAVWYRAPNRDSVRLAVVPEAESTLWRGRAVAFLAFALVAVVLLAGLSVHHFRSFLKERDDFIQATAHDLQTPVAALSLLARREDADLCQAVKRLQNLVGNLKEFLKLGGRRPEAKRDRIELTALFREAYACFREAYEDLDRPVAVEAAGELWAEGDEGLVLQIFWNLLGNDLKYAAPYGPVRVRFAADGARAVVEFADGGPGMSRSAMRRCFDRYYRARTIRESGKGGFGIGLCNAREFARAMRGDLTVRARKPQGCLFNLTLPLSA